MLQLDKLTRLVKKRKRIGRGGDRGGTSGKGGKGQNARSGGGVRPGFEGGQMPIYRRLPKQGFNNIVFARDVKIVNLSQLESFFGAGDTVTKEILCEKKIVKVKKGKKFLLKILGDGVLSKQLTIKADLCSSSARVIIEKLGGVVELINKGE